MWHASFGASMRALCWLERHCLRGRRCCFWLCVLLGKPWMALQIICSHFWLRCFFFFFSPMHTFNLRCHITSMFFPPLWWSCSLLKYLERAFLTTLTEFPNKVCMELNPVFRIGVGYVTKVGEAVPPYRKIPVSPWRKCPIPLPASLPRTFCHLFASPDSLKANHISNIFGNPLSLCYASKISVLIGILD